MKHLNYFINSVIRIKVLVFLSLFCLFVSAQEMKVKELGELLVKAKQIQKNAEKETIYITDSLRKNSANTIQLLGKIPGIRTDIVSDEIKIGKDNNIPVLVNGKEVGMGYVAGINPKRIKKIEIQRYPIGKYSDYPILLNIELFENYIGWDVAANARSILSLENEHTNMENVGINLTITTNKLNVFGSVGYNRQEQYHLKGYERTFGSDYTYMTLNKDYHHPNHSENGNKVNFSMGIDYKITPKHTISIQTWSNISETKNKTRYDVMYKDVTTNQTNFNPYNTQNHTIGVFYKGSVNNKLHFSSELLYDYYDIDEQNKFITNTENIQTRHDGWKNYWRYYAQSSYIMNDKLSGILSYSFIRRSYKNTDKVSRKERYYSKDTRNKADVMLRYRPLNNLDFIAGLSMLGVRCQNREEAKTHISWMPKAKFYYQPAKWVDFTYNYFCDVEYPNLDMLSTVKSYIDNKLYTTGNPNLRERIMHYSELQVTFPKIVKLSYMWKHSENDKTLWYDVSDDAAYVTQTMTDCQYSHHYLGLEGDYNLPKGFRIYANVSYQWYRRFIDKNNGGTTGRTWYLDTEFSWVIPKTDINLMTGYFLRHDKLPLLQGKEYGQEESLKFVVGKTFFNNRMPVSFMVTIPTCAISKHTYQRVDLPGFKSYNWSDDRVNRFMVALNVRYNIGKGRVNRSQNKAIIDNEK
ncbi:MAG: outer membrane beta-barrel protein [Muribaculaceae bacterium]|nr:outer membrane beta-barrel protein [Muribaculaceae bacterium]